MRSVYAFGREEHGAALENLLGRAGELLVERVEERQESQRDASRCSDPEPDPAPCAARADLTEIGEDDPYDQSHLGAFAQCQQERADSGVQR